MQSFDTILFDLDGTLTDPKVGITKSVQHALGRMGITEMDWAKLEQFIGPPLQQSFADVYGMSEEEAWEAVGYYREYFQAVGLFENEVYEGMVPLLVTLQAQGKSLYIATSKPTVFAERIVQHFQMDTFFNGIYGSELDGTRSDKGGLIGHIVRERQLEPARVVMVGDRMHDIIGARKNGIASIGVGYGYGSDAELREASPTCFCRTVGELSGVLATSPDRPSGETA
ncbi:HAD family hydrolase [Paenibacillus cremeus]|uniref:HAD family hydrolase n=1 Tax=Paenibacillus cremeus TaxID=2163881 RepID=A0A559KI31_9BACL|nr:HAD family hydrolase [Paenibacillus cremeus]TVY11797.1 HAD family hydrolase [Paenibacillus cremeus]